MKPWTQSETELLLDLVELGKDVFWIERAFEGNRTRWGILNRIHELKRSTRWRPGAEWSYAEDTYIKATNHRLETQSITLGRCSSEILNRRRDLAESFQSTIVIPAPEERSDPYWHITSTMIQRGRIKPKFFQRMFLKLAGVEWRGYES